MSTITIEQVWLEKNAGNKKATVYFNVDGALVIRASIMNGPTGLFVGLPRSKYEKDGETKYTDEVRFVKESTLANEIRETVMAAYEDAKVNGDSSTKPKANAPAAASTGKSAAPAAGKGNTAYGNRNVQSGKAKTNDAPF